MQANLLKDRVQVQVRVATLTALGETVNWTPVAEVYAQVIPLSVEARAVYQQLNSVATHNIQFAKGAVDISLGNNRILHGSKTYEPTEPPKIIRNIMMVVGKEV